MDVPYEYLTPEYFPNLSEKFGITALPATLELISNANNRGALRTCFMRTALILKNEEERTMINLKNVLGELKMKSHLFIVLGLLMLSALIISPVCAGEMNETPDFLLEGGLTSPAAKFIAEHNISPDAVTVTYDGFVNVKDGDVIHMFSPQRNWGSIPEGATHPYYYNNSLGYLQIRCNVENATVTFADYYFGIYAHRTTNLTKLTEGTDLIKSYASFAIDRDSPIRTITVTAPGYSTEILTNMTQISSYHTQLDVTLEPLPTPTQTQSPMPITGVLCGLALCGLLPFQK